MAAAAVVTAVVATPVSAITPAELVGPDLEPRPVSLAGLREGRISFFDHERRLRSEPAERYVQIRGIGGETSSAAAGAVLTLELVDGQRLVGEWLGGDPEGGAIRWRHPLLGEVGVALEDVRAITRFASGDSGTPADGGDSVVTTNGDTLRGFVSGVGPDQLTIAPDGVDTPVNLPLHRVRALHLANPVSEAHRPEPDQQFVVFRDGSRLLGDRLEISGDRLAFRPELVAGEGAAVAVPLAEVLRVDLVGAGWELVDLAGRGMRVSEGGEVFGVAMPPRVEGDDVVMHAPVSVEVDLPESATRLAATATLDLDDTARATGWADFEIVIPAADPTQSDHRYRLHADQPVLPINVPLGGRLSIRVDPGVNGPILDRLRLRGGVLLLRHEVDPATPD